MSFRTLLPLALMAVAGAVQAQIAPSLLQTSPDGASDNVQALLASAGKDTLVNQQSAGRLFAPCGQDVTLSIMWQRAGLAPEHELGYYLAGDPLTLVPVVGGSSSGLPSSATVSIPGIFGLYLKAGGNTFKSEPSLNGGNNHVAVLADIVGGNPVACSLITSWEDLAGLGDKDYNDIAVQVTGAEAVPEPASMAALGLGALAALRRRRAR